MPEDCRLILGNCRDVLPTIEAGTVDAIVTDPIYPEISRSYGRISEVEWHDLMRSVVAECRRILKPSGSAVFILQPNFETPGRMRPWLWEFMAWTAREWGQVQDAWWFNWIARPTVGAIHFGLMRSSLKACVWLGGVDCYRDQDSVLWEQSLASKLAAVSGRCENRTWPSGKTDNHRESNEAALHRGGVTPMNVLPFRPAFGTGCDHPGQTPGPLIDWWVRYISPPGGLVCDPFVGSGTTALACLKLGRRFVGCDKESSYVEMARRRVAEASREPSLFPASNEAIA